MTIHRGEWTATRARPRGWLVCGLADGRLLHFPESYHSDQHPYLHDPIVDTAVAIAIPPWQAEYPKAIGTAEGWVAMLGGEVKKAASASCALFEPSANTWHEMPSMPAPCTSPAMTLAGGRIVVVAAERVWSWAPGEDWKTHPDLPEAVGRSGVDVRGLADGSVVAWSTREQGKALVRLDGNQWSTLALLDEGVAILPTAEGFRTIGGVADNKTHGQIQEWRATGFTPCTGLQQPRSDATVVRLVDGRTVVAGGNRHMRYMEDTSTGGELDLEYRSFSQEAKYGERECEDLELETPDGWDLLYTGRKFTKWCVIQPLRDGRLCVAQRFSQGLDYFAETYVWTPPATDR